MTLRFGIAAVTMLASSVAFSAVTLQAPEEIAIVAINDQEVNTGLFRSAQNNYKVDSGSQTISVRYVEFFQHRDGEHDVLKSGVVTVTTPVLQDGETYKLALVNAPKTFEAAKKFAEQPVIGLYNQKGQLLVQQAGVNTSSKPWLSKGVFGGGNTVDLRARVANQPAPMYSNIAVQPTQATTVPSATGTVDQQMATLWKKASKAERQKFMAWLAEQAN